MHDVFVTAVSILYNSMQQFTEKAGNTERSDTPAVCVSELAGTAAVATASSSSTDRLSRDGSSAAAAGGECELAATAACTECDVITSRVVRVFLPSTTSLSPTYKITFRF